MVLAIVLITFLCISSFILQYGKSYVRCSNPHFYDKIYLWLIFSLLYILLAFRDETVGNDTVAYFNIYRNISELSFSELFDYEGRFEIGYLFINKVLSYLFPDPQFLLIITGVFILMSNAQFIYKYSQMVWLSVLWYFSLRYFDANMNILRQALAIGCILYSYSFLRSRKFWPFLFLVILGSLFHISAIIFVVVWFVTKIRFKPRYIMLYLLGLLGMYVLSSFFINLLFHYNIIYGYYINSEYQAEGKIAPLMNLLMNLCIVGIGFMTQSYKTCIRPGVIKGTLRCINDNNMMLMILLFASFIQVAALSFALLERVSVYFQIFSIVFLPNSLKCIRQKELYSFLLFFIVIICIAYYLIVITYRPDWNKVYPYHFCF